MWGESVTDRMMACRAYVSSIILSYPQELVLHVPNGASTYGGYDWQ